jgi:hypothetical protein
MKMNIPAQIAAAVNHRGNESFMQPSLQQRVREDSNVSPTAVSHMVSLVVVKVLAALTHRRNFDYLPAVIVTNPQVFAGRRQRFWNPGNLHGGTFLQRALSIESHGRFLQAQSYTAVQTECGLFAGSITPVSQQPVSLPTSFSWQR